MKNKGITLIALIITIIVMLILVAVTMSMAINGGLFGYAGNAARDTELAKQDEQNLVDVESGLSTEELIATYTGQEMPKPAYSTDLLNENGVLTRNAIYTDSNTEIAEIPKGFGIVEDYNIINQGLVISDEFDINGNSIGNEFVWIPVNDYTPSGNVDSNGLDSAFLARFSLSKWSNNERVEGLESSYVEPYTSAAQWEIDEHTAMMQSVQEHKGFYIGRYETGQKENDNIVVKRDKIPYNNIYWGNTMTGMGSTTRAVYLSQHMYTGGNYGVTSTLCYGVQWDAMLDFIKDSTHDVNVSSDWGNYSNTNANTWKITRRTAQYYKDDQWNAVTQDLTKSAAGNVLLTTGANDNFQAKNIFDVAGNLKEWTMEAGGSSRVTRGGVYNTYGTARRSCIKSWLL